MQDNRRRIASDDARFKMRRAGQMTKPARRSTALPRLLIDRQSVNVSETLAGQRGKSARCLLYGPD